jgi:hypothetical protein
VGEMYLQGAGDGEAARCVQAQRSACGRAAHVRVAQLAPPSQDDVPTYPLLVRLDSAFRVYM